MRFIFVVLLAMAALVAPAQAAGQAVNTIIDSGPSGATTSTSATFTFHGTKGAKAFRCSLDNAAFTACTSPKTYSGLSVGSHNFSVAAVNKQNQVDPTPASRSWTVEDNTPPPPPAGVNYITPTDGATVSGIVPIRVTVPAGTDWIGIYSGFCPGNSVGEDLEPDANGVYEVTWDTTECQNTPQANLETFAFKDDGTNLGSKAINVTINNAPAPAPQCSNGVNDDPAEDTLVDFPLDPGCTSGLDQTEAPNPTTSPEPGPIAGQGYTKVWGDEFDSFDRTTWCNKLYWEPTPPTGSQAVANGELRLTRTRASGWSNTSISTEPNCGQANPKEFVQGYFEARMKWDTVRGNGPAFWLLGRHGKEPMPFCSTDTGSDPMCLAAELDVIEGFGNIQYGGSRMDDWYSGALHRNTSGWYNIPDTVRSVQVGTGAEMENYHTYAAKWTANEVCWYFDNALLGCRQTFDSTNQPQHVILYNWNTVWEDENMPVSTSPDLNVWVDWVRVWQQ